MPPRRSKRVPYRRPARNMHNDTLVTMIDAGGMASYSTILAPAAPAPAPAPAAIITLIISNNIIINTGTVNNDTLTAPVCWLVSGRGPVDLRREEVVHSVFQGQELSKNFLHGGEPKGALAQQYTP